MLFKSQNRLNPEVAGLQVFDLYEDTKFLQRPCRVAAIERQIEGMHRLAIAFVLKPDHILQELANTAVDLCGADSAGITMENTNERGEKNLQWVATAGRFAHLRDFSIPGAKAACATGIERGRPQLFRTAQPFYDRMRIPAAPVTDGILIPWRAGLMRGTVWIMAHRREEAFDCNDARLLETMASFAAMAVRQQKLQKQQVEQAAATAAATMANDLAHHINNPLQCLANRLYLAKREGGTSASELAAELYPDLERLTKLVQGLLEDPVRPDVKTGVKARKVSVPCALTGAAPVPRVQ